MGAAEHIGDPGRVDVVLVEIRLGQWILKRGGKVEAGPELAAVHRLRHRHLHDERDPLVHGRFRVIPEALHPVPACEAGLEMGAPHGPQDGGRGRFSGPAHGRM
jgi:hypothetical protein